MRHVFFSDFSASDLATPNNILEKKCKEMNIDYELVKRSVRESVMGGFAITNKGGRYVVKFASYSRNSRSTSSYQDSNNNMNFKEACLTAGIVKKAA